MADRVLVDTNVLLYAYDRGEPVKQARAAAVIDRLATLRLGRDRRHTLCKPLGRRLRSEPDRQST